VSELKSHKAIGDQKIDLKILSQEELGSPFYALALAKAVLLNPG